MVQMTKKVLRPAIDWGGFWHVSDETFTLFRAIEEHVRQILTAADVSKLDNNSE